MSVQQILSSYTVVAAAVQTVFSSANKAPDISLGAGDTEADSSSTGNTGGVVLSVSSKSAGKYYVEFMNIQSYSAGTALAAGLHRNTANLTAFLGQNANGWGSWIEGSGGGTRRTYNNNSGINSSSVTLALNQRCRMAVDFDNGKVWFAHFGQSAWIGGGDPVAGTSPTYTFSVDTDAFYLAACPRGGNVSGSRNTLRLVAPSAWANSAPSGFGVWT